VKGIYILIIRISKPIRPKVGALGEIVFPTGLYAYVGSAQNSLESRVRRHLRKEKRLFWHIDYLLSERVAEVVEVYCLEGDKTCECQTAQLLAKHAVPVPRFGCSDCQCTSHLFCSDSFGFLNSQMKKLAFSSE
jgi:Uri superfamily endonuclease